MSPMESKTSNNDVRVLVVEDSPTQAERLKHLLDRKGYSVAVARDGNEALEEAGKRKPDIIVSDVVMPEMDGFAFCEKLKAQREFQDIPFVLLTVLSSPQDIIRGLQCGADNFIRKPYDGKYILARIEHLLANRRLRQNEKITVGLKVRFQGQDHVINSDRQQILDLLISIFEEAVQLNSDLERNQKELRRSYQSLDGLYRIATGINGALSEQAVVDEALARAMELPNVRAGWIVLLEEGSGFRRVAALGLPPALANPEALEGDCLCRRKLLLGELDRAVNIGECERLQKAVGDTQGMRYHATVPLWAGGRTLGLMNLVGTERGMFGDDELKILHGAGNQIGVALERARLMETLEEKVRERTAALTVEVAERRRAQEQAQRSLEQIRALHEIDLAVSSSLDLRTVLDVLLEKIGVFFPLAAASAVVLINKQTGELEPATCRNLDEREWRAAMATAREDLTAMLPEDNSPLAIRDARTDPRPLTPELLRKYGLVSYLRVPLLAKGNLLGVLTVFTQEEHSFTREETEFLATLAGHAAIAVDNAQLYENVVKSNKVKDDFLSVMSHELRTPLNVVMGYTALMKDGLLGEINPRQEAALQRVLGQADEQLAMINNVLHATVLGSHESAVKMEQLNPSHFLDQLRADYDMRLFPEGLALQWDYPNDLPVMRTDGGKLRVVLQNVIGNAVKFTSKGMIAVSAEMTEEGRQIQFKVVDTGIGIPREQLPFIFDKFHQADSSQTRPYGGVGMGLYIVKRFTELLGGTVKVESEPGKGSTFSITVPFGSG